MKNVAIEQTPEELVFQALNKLAPGKYRRASVLSHPCRFYHLKGTSQIRAGGKDYNLSLFRFIDGSARIRCQYGCGLEAWNNKPGQRDAWEELYTIVHRDSTNTEMSSETIMSADPTKVIPEEQRKAFMRSSQDWKEGETYTDAALRQLSDKTPDTPDTGALVRESIKRGWAKKRLEDVKIAKKAKKSAAKKRKK